MKAIHCVGIVYKLYQMWHKVQLKYFECYNECHSSRPVVRKPTLLGRIWTNMTGVRKMRMFNWRQTVDVTNNIDCVFPVADLTCIKSCDLMVLSMWSCATSMYAEDYKFSRKWPTTCLVCTEKLFVIISAFPHT